MFTSMPKRPFWMLLPDPGDEPGGTGSAEGGNGGGGTPPAEKKTDDEFKSAESKSAVLADLASERDRRQAAEKRLQEIEDAAKTDDQRKTETDAKTAKDLAESQRKNLQYAAAADAGLPLKWAQRIAGSTAEEMAASATELLADIAEMSGKGEHTPGAGATGSGQAPQTSPGMGTLTAAYEATATNRK